MLHRLSLLAPLAGLALAATACSSAGATVASTPAQAKSAAAPVPLPPVQLATLTGGHTEVARLANGRVALVSLWATWCDSCEKEMDALNRLHAATAQGRDAVVIGIDAGEDAQTVAAFVARRGLRYAQLLDERFELADAVGQRRLPCTLVLDRRGRVVFRGDALDARALEALRRTIAEAVQP
jgi:peroxiredoxin